MTAAPNSPTHIRIALAGLATATCLLFGLLTLRAFGLGPALFLFALALVGVVDLVVTLRRDAGRERPRVGADPRHE